MFREIFEEHEAAFHAKQSALIKSIGSSFDDLIASMQAVDETSYGEPPYIVFDGEDALLLVDGEGNYSCLPSHFIMARRFSKAGFKCSLPHRRKW